MESLSLSRSVVGFFEGEQRNLKEDAYAVVVNRPYKPLDLNRLERVFHECVSHGINIQINVGLRLNGTSEPLLKNFRLTSAGIQSVLEATRSASRQVVKQKLAAARSAGDNSKLLVRELRDVFETLGEEFFEIHIFLRKSELSKALFARRSGHEVQLWFGTRNFLRFIGNEPLEFLKLIWKSEEPTVVLLSYSGVIRSNFCMITGRLASPAKFDMEMRKVIGELILEIVRDKVSVPFALALTLSPVDKASKRNASRLFGPLPSVRPLLMSESQLYDFKQTPPEGAKPIVSFANACGGLMICGVSREGDIVGCDPTRDPDRIADSLKEVRPIIRCKIVDVRVNNKSVLAIFIRQAKTGVVHHLQNGERPFRYMSTTKLFAYDEDVLRERAEICRT